jgi:hypothetical protein
MSGIDGKWTFSSMPYVMVPTPDLNAVSFHEASVVAFRQNGAEIELRLEGVWSKQGPRSATLILKDVARCEIDESVVAAIHMEAADGEVLSLHVRDDGIDMLVEWNDWATRSHSTRSYDLRAESVLVTVAR